MVALPLLSDPTPQAIEALLATLPPQVRSAIAWFPTALRSTLIDPLDRASAEELRSTLDAVALPAIRLFLRLFEALASRPEALQGLLKSFDDEQQRVTRHTQIAQRLGPREAAATDLSEAVEWFRVIVKQAARLDDERPAVPASASFSDEEIRAELEGRTGPFWRALLLMSGALEVVLGRPDPLPEHIGAWCRLALQELHAAANTLRADGLPLPTLVQIPQGSSHTSSPRRATRQSLLSLQPANPCPPGVVARIVEVLAPEQIWLFGSRARGTANERSDWDLLLILPNGSKVSLDDRQVWASLRDVRRQRVDLSAMSRADFDTARSLPGTLAHIAASEGVVVYDR